MCTTRSSVPKVHLVSIVDDDASVREATTDLLKSHGYVAAAFASAEEFLQSEDFCETFCLVTDVRMGGLSGLELQRHLVNAGHQIPVVFMSAFPEEHIRTAALEGGALDLLAKPVDEERLIGCLESAFESRIGRK